MIRHISKIGNSQGLIFDQELLAFTGLERGDQVNLTLHQDGRIILTPMNPRLRKSMQSQPASSNKTR